MASSGESPADVAPSGADRTAATRRPGVAALQLAVLRLQTSRSTFRRYRRLAPERLARSGHAMARRWASVVQARVPALEPWFFAYPQAVGRQTEPALLPAALAAGADGKGCEGGRFQRTTSLRLRRGKSADDLLYCNGAQRRCKCVRATQCRIHERKVLRSRVRWGMIIRVCFVELSSLRRPHTARSTSRWMTAVQRRVTEPQSVHPLRALLSQLRAQSRLCHAARPRPRSRARCR